MTCENEDEEPYWVDFRIVRYNGNRWVPQTEWDVDSRRTPECRSTEDDQEITEEMVIREMESADLPTGSISVNPPNGRTLVNLDTVFATDQGETQIPLTLEEVGVEIQLNLTPVAYHWDFGDGETATWETKGRPWEEGVPVSEYHTYAYSDTDTYDVTLTIEYQVEWNAGDGWQTIAGTSESAPSDPCTIEVVEKRNRLRDGG